MMPTAVILIVHYYSNQDLLILCGHVSFHRISFVLALISKIKEFSTLQYYEDTNSFSTSSTYFLNPLPL